MKSEASHKLGNDAAMSLRARSTLLSAFAIVVSVTAVSSLGVPSGHAGEMFIPSHDAYVTSDDPGENFGTDTSLIVGKDGSGDWYYSYVSFNLGSIPWCAEINTARLWLPCQGSNFDHFNLCARCVSGPWSEYTITWNNHPGSWDEPRRCMYPDQECPLADIVVTQHVQKWVSGEYYNYGFVLFPYSEIDPGEIEVFYSREAAGGDPPYLIVDYSLPVPDEPNNVAATDGEYETKVRVTWDPVCGAEEYRVYRDGQPQGSWQEETTYDDPNVIYCETYNYKVKAWNEDSGEGDLSDGDDGYAGSEPSPPTSASASPNPACAGETVILSASGGSGGTLTWYENGCGSGEPIGTGSPITITAPSSTTTYYVRRENDCGDSNCVSLSVSIKTPSSAPTGASAAPSSVCLGGSSTLTVQGGSLGTGASWEWYRDSCGGTHVGSGSSIAVSPSSTTTYYVRAEGDCNTTTCASATVTVETRPSAPTAVSASDGDYDDKVRLDWDTVSGATSYKIYRSTSNSQCSDFIDNDDSPPYDDSSATPGTTYYYSVKAVNDCGDGDCSSTDSGYAEQPPDCGNGICDPGETPCNCAEDCGQPPATETNCSDGVDNDCDGLIDCDDPDCDDDLACIGVGACCLPGGGCIVTTEADCTGGGVFLGSGSSCDACQGPLDSDNDEVIDTQDNCPLTSNANQADSDADGVGDACDNCPATYNPGQEDDNNNDIGNACDPCGVGVCPAAAIVLLTLTFTGLIRSHRKRNRRISGRG